MYIYFTPFNRTRTKTATQISSEHIPSEHMYGRTLRDKLCRFYINYIIWIIWYEYIWMPRVNPNRKYFSPWQLSIYSSFLNETRKRNPANFHYFRSSILNIIESLQGRVFLRACQGHVCMHLLNLVPGILFPSYQNNSLLVAEVKKSSFKQEAFFKIFKSSDVFGKIKS